MAPSDGPSWRSCSLRRRAASLSESKLHEGGATSPQGTDVDRTWVDISQRRGRRSPLVSRPEYRPTMSGGWQFGRRNGDDRGTARGEPRGTSSNWTLSSRCPPLAIICRCAPRRTDAPRGETILVWVNRSGTIERKIGPPTCQTRCTASSKYATRLFTKLSDRTPKFVLPPGYRVRRSVEGARFAQRKRHGFASARVFVKLPWQSCVICVIHKP